MDLALRQKKKAKALGLQSNAESTNLGLSEKPVDGASKPGVARVFL
jgi:hypothetical protein